jgi:hypothetical protein
LKTKIGKLKNLLFPTNKELTVKNTRYNFVDFRIKRTGGSNYGGLHFVHQLWKYIKTGQRGRSKRKSFT